MTGPGPNEDELPRHPRRGVYWQKAIPIVSLAISLGAVAFTALQWREAHNQLLLAMKPSVDFDTEDDPDEPPAGLAISNAGPGPAIIKSLTYYVDRKQVRDVSEALDYGKVNTDQVSYFELDPDDTLAVGEKDWLLKYHGLHGSKFKQKDLDAFVDFIDQHLAVEVSFCSLTGECSTKCSTKGRC
jgi:hypothetical protein